jgi:hypothetical protein
MTPILLIALLLLASVVACHAIAKIALVHDAFDCGDGPVLQRLGPGRLRQVPADQDADADPEEG